MKIILKEGNKYRTLVDCEYYDKSFRKGHLVTYLGKKDRNFIPATNRFQFDGDNHENRHIEEWDLEPE